MTRSLRIAILIPRLSGGGAEYVANAWGRYLSTAGNSVTMVLTHGAKSADVDSLPSVSLAGLGSIFGSIYRFRHQLKSTNYDVVLSLMPYSNLVSIISSRLLRSPNRPGVVISEHNLQEGLAAHLGFGVKLQLVLARRLYRLANAVIAVSHAVGAEVVSRCGIASSKLWVIANPAAQAVTRQTSRSSVDKFATLSLVVPARLVPQKRPWLAISTAQLIIEMTGLPTTVHFFGVGELEPTLRAMAISSQVNCEFHGWVDGWFNYVPEDGVVLLPSVIEGFGNVLVEAAAVSVPVVVSSRTLGASDAVIPNVTGIITAGDDAEAFAEGVLLSRSIEIGGIDNWLARFTQKESGPVLITCLESAVRADEVGLR